jgi:MFS family permease
VLPESRDYTRALALSRLAYDLEALVSPVLAAALLTIISYNNLFIGTALGFACSAILVVTAKLPARESTTTSDTFWQRLPTGVRVFLRTPSLRFVMATNLVVGAGTAIVLVNSVVYVKATFHYDDSALALTLGAYGLGSLVTAFSIPFLVERFGVIRTMVTGSFVIAAALALSVGVSGFFVSPAIDWPILLGTWVVMGVGTSLVNTPSSRLLADASTPQNRNLVYTAQFALSHACFLITYPVAGWLGAVSLFGAAVALFLIATVACVAVSVTAALAGSARSREGAKLR